MAGGLFSHYQQKSQKQYASNPANFAVGQNKVWEELSSTEKASSLFQEYGKKTVDFSKEVGVGMAKAVAETGTALADTALRTSPIETARNVASGIQEVMKGTSGVPVSLAFEKGFQESKARPLMFEKLTGENLKNKDGTVNWDFARKFVGRAMEGPTYAYAGGVQAGELIGKGLLSRILTRTASTLPEAGINTALQAGEQGNTDNIGQNFLINALLMSGVSNVVGEIKLPKDILNNTVSDIETQVGKLTPEQKIDVQDALKQGVKSDEILANLKKVVKNEITPEEVAAKVNAAIVPKEPLDATSVASYIDKNGVKVTTRLSKQELEVLADEIRTIPAAKDGNSQIHLDAETPVLKDAVKDGTAREVSRDEFIAGHPQAKEVFEKTRVQGESPLLQEARKYESAEEFVKAQGTPLYRGATKDSMLRDRGRGTSFSTDKSVAEKFVTNDQTGAPRTNGVMGEFVLPSDAKVLDASSLTASKIKADLNRTNIVKYAKENGYDAIRFGDKTAKGTGWASEEEIRILNHDKIKTKSQLTDLYNKAQGGAPKAEPKTVEVLQSQTPVGTGQEKVSRLEARMTGNLGKLTPEQIDEIGLSTYNQMNKAEQIKGAAEYVTANPNDVIKILSGEMEPPKGLLRNSIYVAAENAAHDDAGLARKLASLQSTRLGQELSILSEAMEDSPVKAMRDVSDARIQAVERRLKSGSVSKTRNEITKKAKESVDKTVTKAIKEDWASFVESISCRT